MVVKLHGWKAVRPYVSDIVRFFHISHIEAKSRHRGTHLGIIWVPLSSLIFSAMLAFVFRQSDTMSFEDFFFYVLSGYIFWGFIATSITGSTDVIQNQYDFAVHNNLSLPGLFGKLLIDRLFVYFLNLVLLIALLLLFSPEKLGPALFLFVPFLGLIVVTSLSIAYLVNLVTIFYPDTKTLFSVCMRFMFFVSPVFWSAGDKTDGLRALLVQYNPAAYFLSLPRQVFGIEPVDLKAWLVAIVALVIASVAASFAYQHSQGFVRNLK